ncbi:MAG TPA: hypothetical protein VIB00_07125 [Pyrinomonadaceae bacterium]|jgi:hypothetical protein
MGVKVQALFLKAQRGVISDLGDRNRSVNMPYCGFSTAEQENFAPDDGSNGDFESNLLGTSVAEAETEVLGSKARVRKE